MWVVALLLATATSASDTEHEASVTSLHKCCGPHSSFRQDMVTGDLECHVAVSPLHAHGAQVRHGLPESCNTSVIAVKPSTVLPVSRNCIDKVEDESEGAELSSVVGFLCADEDSVRSVTSPNVMTVKKCCVNGSYDPGDRICRDITDGKEKLENIILRDSVCFINFEYGLSECRPNEALAITVVDTGQIELLDNSSVLVNTSEEILMLDDEAFCMDTVANSSDSVVVKFCQSVETACRKRPCVQKCCPDGQGMIHSKSCTPSDFDFNPQFYNIVSTNGGFERTQATVPSFAVLSNLNCDKFILRPEATDGDISYLEVDGRLYVPKHKDPHLTTDMYCLEKVIFPEEDMVGIYAFLCFPEDNVEEDTSLQFILCSLGLITSSVFLLATFLVYACVPSLQNLHGKTLMCHVVSLFAAYVCLSVAQLGSDHLDFYFCAAMGYCILLTFLAAFSWLNIMCFDIWWTFGVIRSMSQGGGSRKQRERRRFIAYSIYAWGLPSFLTAITAAVDVLDLSPATLKPDMGVHYCWFSKMTYGIAVYFFGPVSPMITCNVVLFVLTARSCSKVKAEIYRMQQNSIGDRCKRRYQADKNKLIMNAKLFVVMGVTWTLEIVSSFLTEPPWIWYLSDTANALQGALIFCIFVLKRKVIRTLAHQLGFHNLRQITRPNTAEHLTCYDPYRVRKASSNSTLCTTITDTRSARFTSGSCK